MRSSKGLDAVIIDIEDIDSGDNLLEAFKNRQIPVVSCTTVEELFGRAEQSLKDGLLKSAEAQFRKGLLSLAYCEMDLLSKQELARICADRLADLRPRIGKEPILQFSELTHGGIVHMYAFEIEHRSERQRLVCVIADREVMHDSGKFVAFKQDRQPKGSMKMPFKEDPLKRIPRNAPCPCGSGKKYKKCCMGKI